MKGEPSFTFVPANVTAQKGEDLTPSKPSSQLQNLKFESSISKKLSLRLPDNGQGIGRDQFYTFRDQKLNMSKSDTSLDKEEHQDCKHHKIKKIIAAGFKIYRHNLDGDKVAYITKPKGRKLFKDILGNYQVPKKKKKQEK